MYGIYTVNFECVWTCVCVWTRCVPMREEAGHSCKSLNSSKWTSRRHKFAWSWWPPTCSHALMHAGSNAAEMDCTALSLRAQRSHSATCIGIILGYFQGGTPWVPPTPRTCWVRVIIFSSKIGQATKALHKLWFPGVKYIRVKDGLSML